ncbi:MAG: hypothetical protein ACODAA_03750, partial [Gemmatimonadota bacterium]
DEALANPAIDAGDAVSLRTGVEFRRRTTETNLRTRAVIEVADSSVAGDFSFLMGELRASWAGPAPAGHGLEAFLLARGDLSGGPPRQRWTALGGLATLPRLPLLSLGGPRVVYGQVTYLVPIERLRLGLIGPPRLFLRGATGAAWDEGGDPDFETNVIGGVRLFVFELALAIDPSASDLDPAVYATLRFPGDL